MTFRLRAASSLHQLFRFGVVGVANNLLGFGLYLLITYLGVEPKLTMSVLYCFGATLAYIGNRQWSFQHEGSIVTSAFRYGVVHLIGFLMNLTILIVFVDYMDFPHQWVQGCAIFVVAGYLFLAFKYFVFGYPQDFSDTAR